MKEENPENQTLTFYNKENESENKKPTKKETTKKRFVIIFCFILSIAVLVPLCIYFITINIVIETDVHHTCAVDDLFKIPCGRVKISENDCLKISCCFDDQRLNCYHYMPSKYNYVTENGLDFNSLQPRTPFNNNSISQLKLSIIEIDSNRMKIMVHEPSTKPNSTATIQNKTYHVKQDPQFLGVQIFRQDTKEMILSTLMGPLIASDHYWEWTIYLVNDHIFGLGDIVFPKNKTFSKVIYKNKNNHNTLPNFMVYLNGSFYGILVEHDGPLEVTVFPGRIISLKSLAGYKISVNIYTGPTIQNVIEQMRLDGSTYSMPYWSLGIHICRDGLTTIDNALKEFEEFYSTQNDIHYASDCVHENLYNLLHHVKPEHGLPALITSLQQKQTKFLMSMPPQVLKANEILYNSSVELNILYRNSSDEILNGIYKNEEATYPDYTHSSIGKWFEKVKSTLPTNIDGFVLRDNWPQEDVYIFRDPEYNFPYMTDSLNNSMSNTIHWNASSFGDSLQPHILHHNSYGTSQLSAFRNFMNYEFISTSSSNAGVFEPITIQNVNISWTNFKKAVTTSLCNGMFGNYMTSVPVCGSTSAYHSKANDELCLRWYITSATFPFFRISSDFPRRDPSNLFSGFSKNAVKDAIQKRHMLLPYFYTILYGEVPLVRPMIYNFHTDNVTWNLDEQYMLGDALLVVQPFLASVTKIFVYLPPAINVWYEFWGGNVYQSGWNSLNVVKNDWIMFMSEGHVIPLRHHKSSQIGAYTSHDSYGFAVALKCSAAECYAEGLLQLNTAQLHLTADRTGIILNNLSEAKNDIGCNLVEPNYPKYIENMMIYGISETVLHSNSSVIDLCTISEPSVRIPYFLM